MSYIGRREQHLKQPVPCGDTAATAALLPLLQQRVGVKARGISPNAEGAELRPILANLAVARSERCGADTCINTMVDVPWLMRSFDLVPAAL